MKVYSFAPLPVGVLAWNDPEPCLTVITKLTLRFGRDGFAIASAQEPLSHAIPSLFGSPAELHHPPDFVPRKERCDLILTGSAYAAMPLAAIGARVRVGVFHKRFFAMAGEPTPAIPLSVAYLRNKRRFDAEQVTVSAMASTHPERAKYAEVDAAFDGQPLALMAIPADFDFSYFNAAPEDQQLDALEPGTPLSLEGLSPDGLPCTGHLPEVWPQIFALTPEGARLVEIPLTCDTLWIDTDRNVAVLTLRGTWQTEARGGRGGRGRGARVMPLGLVVRLRDPAERRSELLLADLPRAVPGVALRPQDVEEVGPELEEEVPEEEVLEELDVEEIEAEPAEAEMEAEETTTRGKRALPPGTAQPAFAQPAISQPAFAQPAISQPSFAQPAFGLPAISPPAIGPPAIAPPAIAPPAIAPPPMVPPPMMPGGIAPPPFFAARPHEDSEPLSRHPIGRLGAMQLRHARPHDMPPLPRDPRATEPPPPPRELDGPRRASTLTMTGAEPQRSRTLPFAMSADGSSPFAAWAPPAGPPDPARVEKRPRTLDTSPDAGRRPVLPFVGPGQAAAPRRPRTLDLSPGSAGRAPLPFRGGADPASRPAPPIDSDTARARFLALTGPPAEPGPPTFGPPPGPPPLVSSGRGAPEPPPLVSSARTLPDPPPLLSPARGSPEPPPLLLPARGSPEPPPFMSPARGSPEPPPLMSPGRVLPEPRAAADSLPPIVSAPPPFAAPEAQGVPWEHEGPRPPAQGEDDPASISRVGLLPLAVDAAIQQEIWQGTAPLHEILARHGVGEVEWRDHLRRRDEALRDEAAKGAVLRARAERLALDRARRPSEEPEAPELDMAEYAEIRALLDSGDSRDEAAILAARGVPGEVWEHDHRLYRKRLREQPAFAERFREALDEAKSALATGTAAIGPRKKSMVQKPPRGAPRADKKP